ncbi:hypothetical protein HS041_37910 [Planomonospora sp. ID67723]|uniref:hypothetical protein n=1 Tax=Planomonospora sp. ID67723 TaxID=2738134 RepID=UPI0018C37A40|nr:hypothetical protein [Planomonospora sp. ID67723]MBG0833481.1 hypothetical protein [Planomonospora sp. ID67723]
MIDPAVRRSMVQMLLDADAATDPAELAREVMRVLLYVGSETPCNLNCAENLDYGPVPAASHRPAVSGLKVKGTDLLVSEVAHAIEDLPLPSALAREFPELTAERWDAVTRMITMLLRALEREHGHTGAG